jgi:hypothetical protein
LSRLDRRLDRRLDGEHNMTVAADPGCLFLRAEVDDQGRGRSTLSGPVDLRRNQSIDAAQVKVGDPADR